MIVIYADGGGLGHLTRTQAIRHTLRLIEPVTVLTSSGHGDDVRVTGGMQVVPIPIRRVDVAARRSWLQRTIQRLEPSLVVVDAFPAGLAGELDADAVPPSTPCIHLARLLRWPAYRRVLPVRPIRFERTYVLEPLHDDHQHFLTQCSDAVEPLRLSDPPAIGEHAGAGVAHVGWPDLTSFARSETSTEPERPRWLVTHAGPASEVADLVAHARDQAFAEGVSPVFVVASPADAAPRSAPDIVVVDRYPVWPLFSSADRIITAAGFNAMRQLADHRDRHRFVPMERRFDDQFERARRARFDESAATAVARPSNGRR